MRPAGTKPSSRVPTGVLGPGPGRGGRSVCKHAQAHSPACHPWEGPGLLCAGSGTSAASGGLHSDGSGEFRCVLANEWNPSTSPCAAGRQLMSPAMQAGASVSRMGTSPRPFRRRLCLAPLPSPRTPTKLRGGVLTGHRTGVQVLLAPLFRGEKPVKRQGGVGCYRSWSPAACARPMPGPWGQPHGSLRDCGGRLGLGRP